MKRACRSSRHQHIGRGLRFPSYCFDADDCKTMLMVFEVADDEPAVFDGVINGLVHRKDEQPEESGLAVLHQAEQVVSSPDLGRAVEMLYRGGRAGGGKSS